MSTDTPVNPVLTADQKQLLLDKQLSQALAGDTALLIHLGATQLGQIKETRLQLQQVPSLAQSHTYDELLDLVEDRLREHGLAPTLEHTSEAPVVAPLALPPPVTRPALYTAPPAADEPEPAELGDGLDELALPDDDWRR